MGKVSWLRYNIFMSFDQPAYLLIDIGFTHRLRIYESEDIVYLDDVVTGRNRPAGVYELRAWTENAHGEPPIQPAFYNLYVDVYDTNNVLIERHTLTYMYAKGKYFINVVDENGNPLNVEYTYMIRSPKGVFFLLKLYGYTFSLPDSAGYNWDIEMFCAKSKDKKYYLIGTNLGLAPSLPGGERVTNKIIIKPRDRIVVGISYNINVFKDIPILKEIGDFVGWLSEASLNYLAIPIGSMIANALGIRLPIVGAKYENGVLTVYHEQDIEFITAVLIMFAIGAGVAAAIAWIIKEIRLAEISYEIVKVVHESQERYYNLVDKVWEYASQTPNPEKTFTEMMGLIQPPTVNSTDVAKVLEQKDDTIRQLKDLLVLALGGAAIIVILSMARK